MEVLPSALRHGIDAEDIQHALTHALSVDQVGEDPARYLVLGPDRAANLLELVVLDRPPRASRHPRDGDAGQVPTPTTRREMTTNMTPKRKANDNSVSAAQIDALADEAERGYDVEEILQRRRGGRPPLGSAAASVESVRLDPELKRDLLLRAARDHTSVSEIIRRAIGEYLHAS